MPGFPASKALQLQLVLPDQRPFETFPLQLPLPWNVLPPSASLEKQGGTPFLCPESNNLNAKRPFGTRSTCLREHVASAYETHFPGQSRNGFITTLGNHNDPNEHNGCQKMIKHLKHKCKYQANPFTMVKAMPDLSMHHRNPSTCLSLDSDSGYFIYSGLHVTNNTYTPLSPFHSIVAISNNLITCTTPPGSVTANFIHWTTPRTIGTVTQGSRTENSKKPSSGNVNKWFRKKLM